MNAYDPRLLGDDINDHLSFEFCWIHGLDPLCWIWTGPLQNRGYGQLGDRASLVHRYAYMILVGQIPKGLYLDHLCRRRDCCNPAHLEPVTHQVNCQRGADAARNGVPSCNGEEARELFARELGRQAAAAMSRMLYDKATS